MTRYLLAFLLVLTGLMVVTAPVAVMAMSATKLCEQRADRVSEHAAPQSASAGADHAHHGAGQSADRPADGPDAPSRDSTQICCDNACVVELTVMPFAFGAGLAVSGAPHDLSADNLTELAQPGGLRRPPKA